MRSLSSMGRLGSLLGLGLLLGACDATVNVGGGGTGGPLAKADKVDLLLVVDNSRSMADKQEILSRALSDLIDSLANPPCIDANGIVSAAPASPNDACPAGQARKHAPVTDIHVGVISSSLGSHGADACPDVDETSKECSGGPNLTNNDKGHLLSRTDACSGATVPTYQGKGFLVWDPKGQASPPGTSDPVELAKNLADMVRGVGQIGCGFESQLESWYRFLADPEPSASTSIVNGEAVPEGMDTELLAGRAAFLRPDSMLVVLSLSDENDCSLKEAGSSYITAKLRHDDMYAFHMPRPRSECATNPDDPCCKSCAADRGDCPVDPTCYDDNGHVAHLSAAEDDVNLRCFDQKRRFGIDALYPVDRYIDALTKPTIANRAGELVPNPIFSDLDPNDGNKKVRDPGMVFMASISGVPWQEIARDPSDLASGFKSAEELSQSGTWNAILGDPATGKAPTSPYMIESITKRTGVAPGNPINGGDYTITENNDLQYACTFPLSAPVDCTDLAQVTCDCYDPNNDNPLCAPDPKNGGARTLQVAAKAHPNPRTMSVVKGIGEQGVLTSVCPAQTTDEKAADYAYRPVMRALLERMATRL